MENDNVILVNENNIGVGFTNKLSAHKEGLLHRAVSVFIINDKGEWLIQKRAMNKYHSSGLWSNSCCSHPFPNETSLHAAERRLHEEMGMNVSLIHAFDFLYKVKLDNDLTEHEYDEIFIGFSNDIPKINLKEAMDFKFIAVLDLEESIKQKPFDYTFWFKELIPKVKRIINEI